jgi:predicted enzyme related to lactoylglutathione lyase
MMPQPPEQAAAGIPAAWTVLVGARHLETVVATTRELGGSVLQTPVSMPGGARVAVIADPAGAALGLMDAPAPESAMAWGDVGAVCWVECLSRDPVAACRFYEQLLGWTSEEGTGGYVVFSRDGERVGGLMVMPSSVPEQAPSHWLVYFAVPDVAVSCERAIGSGGTVLAPAHDIEEGRFAVLADPTGAALAVYEEPVPRP